MNIHQNNCRVVQDGYGICRCHQKPTWEVALERYDLEDVTRMGEAWREITLSVDGAWVKYDEVARLIQTLHEAVKAQTEQAENWERESREDCEKLVKAQAKLAAVEQRVKDLCYENFLVERQRNEARSQRNQSVIDLYRQMDNKDIQLMDVRRQLAESQQTVDKQTKRAEEAEGFANGMLRNGQVLERTIADIQNALRDLIAVVARYSDAIVKEHNCEDLSGDIQMLVQNARQDVDDAIVLAQQALTPPAIP